MKSSLFMIVVGLVLLSSCALMPRRDTIAYPAVGRPVQAPTAVYVHTVDVDRRVLSRELARDVEALVVVLAPGNGFPIVATSGNGAWSIHLHVVERETIRDFSPQYAIMVTLEMFPSTEASTPALTVVHTSESADSISSPWILKRILDDCLHEASQAFAARAQT